MKTKAELSKEELTEVETLVAELASKGELPSTVGHILRDEYNLKVKKLTKVFPKLTQSVEIQRKKAKVEAIKEHLKRNHKDIVSHRALSRNTSKLYNLRTYYKSTPSKSISRSKV